MNIPRKSSKFTRVQFWRGVATEIWQGFNEQELRIKNTEWEEITSEEGNDAVMTGLFREYVERNLTRGDEDLVDVLVD